MRVLDDIAKVHTLQENHGGWIDDMALVSGAGHAAVLHSSVLIDLHFVYGVDCLGSNHNVLSSICKSREQVHVEKVNLNINCANDSRVVEFQSFTCFIDLSSLHYSL